MGEHKVRPYEVGIRGYEVGIRGYEFWHRAWYEVGIGRYELVWMVGANLVFARSFSPSYHPSPTRGWGRVKVSTRYLRSVFTLAPSRFSATSSGMRPTAWVAQERQGS